MSRNFVKILLDLHKCHNVEAPATSALVEAKLLPPSQIISRFNFSRCVVFAENLDICYV